MNYILSFIIFSSVNFANDGASTQILLKLFSIAE